MSSSEASVLDPSDAEELQRVKERLASSESKYKWNRQVDSLVEALEALRTFCIRGNDSDWKRCLACGIFWLKSSIAINIRQMTSIIGKCKSSINGVLLKMGYVTLPLTPSEVFAQISSGYNVPAVFIKQRQWTIRTTEEPEDDIESFIAAEDVREHQCCSCPMQWIHDHTRQNGTDLDSLIM